MVSDTRSFDGEDDLFGETLDFDAGSGILARGDGDLDCLFLKMGDAFSVAATELDFDFVFADWDDEGDDTFLLFGVF